MRKIVSFLGATGYVCIDLATLSESFEVRLDSIRCLVSLETIPVPAKEHDTPVEHMLTLLVSQIVPGSRYKAWVFACVLLRHGARHVRMDSDVVLVLLEKRLPACP